jgi:putative tricarboxylic transport membrane protein
VTGDPTQSVAGGKGGGLRSDQVSGLMLIALALFIGWENRAYPVGTLAEPGPGYLPLLLAAFLGVVGVLVAAWGARSAPLKALRWGETPRAVMILLACAAAALALEPLGYRITIITLLIFFLGAVERRPPLIVGLVAVGFGFASFYVIGDLLHVPLPRSRWGF